MKHIFDNQCFIDIDIKNDVYDLLGLLLQKRNKSFLVHNSSVK